MSRILLSILLLLGLGALSAPANARPTEDERLQQAARVLDEVMRMPEHAIPRKLLTDAYAIAVIPDVVKAGLVLGGRHGRGVISVRLPDGAWSTPSFISLTGGSIGFQEYVDCPHTPRYPFGFGLSYTRFAYTELVVSRESAAARSTSDLGASTSSKRVAAPNCPLT